MTHAHTHTNMHMQKVCAKWPTEVPDKPYDRFMTPEEKAEEEKKEAEAKKKEAAK